MLDFLRDPIWQFIGAAISLAALILAGVALRKQIQRKAFSYQRVAVTPLLSIEDELKGKLEIRYNGQTIEQVHLVLLKIINNGDLPIRPTDFEQSVVLSFGEPPTKILSAEIVETRSPDLHPALVIDQMAPLVSVAPVLFNDGDWVTLKVLVGQFNGVVAVHGRIVGVATISDYDALTTIGVYLTNAGAVLFLIGAVGNFITTAIGESQSATGFAFVLLLEVSLALGIIAIVVDRSMRRELLRRMKKIYFPWLKS